MSRIGKQSIVIPEKTEVTISDGMLSVKGPLGEISRVVRPEVSIEVTEKEVVVTPARGGRQAQALWGTYASHVGNMLQGVNELFEKKLVVEGIGFRAEMSGKDLTLNVGFSHPVVMNIPEGLDIAVEKNVITVKGINKEADNNFIDFLDNLEQNRRTAQVSGVTITPDPQNPSLLSFSLVVNVYIKP